MRIRWVVSDNIGNLEDNDGHEDVDKALKEIEALERNRKENYPDDPQPWRLYKVVDTQEVFEVPWTPWGLNGG